MAGDGACCVDWAAVEGCEVSRSSKCGVCGYTDGRLYSASMDGKDGWAAITVHGFENSPISWGANAHGSLNGGENGYTVLRLPGEGCAGDKSGRCIIYEALGSQDEYS